MYDIGYHVDSMITKLPALPTPLQFHYVSGYEFNTQILPVQIARLFRLFDMRTRKISIMRAVYGCILVVIGF